MPPYKYINIFVCPGYTNILIYLYALDIFVCPQTNILINFILAGNMGFQGISGQIFPREYLGRYFPHFFFQQGIYDFQGISGQIGLKVNIQSGSTAPSPRPETSTEPSREGLVEGGGVLYERQKFIMDKMQPPGIEPHNLAIILSTL